MPATVTAQELASALSCGSPGCRCHRLIRPDAWQVHCPAHSDPGPSLSLKQGQRGVLLTCHAGCSNSEVIAVDLLALPRLHFPVGPILPAFASPAVG